MEQYAVIFDMDGVIFDSEKVWKKQLRFANKVFQVNVTEKERQSTCGKRDFETKKILKDNHPNLDADSFFSFWSQNVYKQMDGNGVKLKSRHFAKYVEDLKIAGYKIALATSNNTKRTKYLFHRAKLHVSKLFDVIVTGDDVKVGKPDPAIFKLTCQKLNLPPQNCFVLEDSENGILSAHSAGCHPIMVIDIIKPSQEIVNICDKVFTNLKQSVNYLIKMSNK